MERVWKGSPVIFCLAVLSHFAGDGLGSLEICVMKNDASKVDWLFSIVRIAGATFPATAALVQLQSEIDSKAMAARIRRLEDPISFLHQDVPETSKRIYAELKVQDCDNLEFDETFYRTLGRPLAALESQGYLKCRRALNRKFPCGIYLADPSYIMYLCALCESDACMADLIERVDGCPVGQWLDGDELKRETGLPLQVVSACFSIYESKGYGLCSKTLAVVRYMGKA